MNQISSEQKKSVRNWLVVPRVPLLAFTGLGFGILIFSLDQISKWLVLHYPFISQHTLPVTSFLNIILVWNRGISFGLLSNSSAHRLWFLAGVGCMMTAVLSLWVWKAETRTMAWGAGSVLGGAVGNLVDRFRFGAVTDFIDFHIYGYHWYTFNIADAAILIGITLLIFEYYQET